MSRVVRAPVAQLVVVRRQGVMGSKVDTVQYICDQAGLGRRLTYRKMFGEYALYLDAKVVALICDDQLFLKPTPEGLKYLGEVTEAPPYPGARNFYLLSAVLDDTEILRGALLVTARALPEPRPKTVRSGSKAKTVKKKRKVTK
jgi:TfoX/Sxy family transcriptional regulator of competence genes